jgi:hypothetical protein
MANNQYDLGRFNGLYPGFEQDREMLRERLPNADIQFREACEALATSDNYIGRPDPEPIARKAMRVLVTNVLAAGQ